MPTSEATPPPRPSDPVRKALTALEAALTSLTDADTALGQAEGHSSPVASGQKREIRDVRVRLYGLRLEVADLATRIDVTFATS